MKRISDSEFRRHFIAWQCRIRQIAMRDYGGRPLSGMTPRVSTRRGEVLIPAMTTLITHGAPREVTDYFRFLVQKTNDPEKTREGAVNFLGADYYQQPELFSDSVIAVFATDSVIVPKLLKLKTVLLDFAQFSQSYRMFCCVRSLPASSEARQAALWHNRLFNPNLPNDAVTLAFSPDWKTAQADPMPGA